MRSGVETGLVAAMAGLAALGWTAGEPGASAPVVALRAADGSVLPPVLAVRALAPHLGLDAALVVVSCLSFAVSMGLLWSVLRARSTSRIAAGAGLVVGGLTPLALRSLGLGLPDLSAVGFAAAGVAAFGERRLLPGLAWAAVAASFDARMGGAVAVVGATIGGGAWALLGGIALLGSPVRGLADATGGVHVSAAVVAAAALPGRWRVPLVVSVVLALGAILPLAGATVPLPAYFLALFAPDGDWSAVAVVAGAVASLAVAELSTRGASAIAALALADAAFRVGLPPAGGSVAPPLAVTSVAERSGTLLDLPFEVEGLPCAAPPGTNLAWAWQGRLHGRPRLVGTEAVAWNHAAFGEPAVVAALNLQCGTRFMVPPGLPAVTLGALGVTEVAVHRRRYDAAALAIIDPVYARQYGPPIRDHAGEVDLYRVRPNVSGVATAGGLHLEGAAAAASWQSLDAFLQGALPPASPRAKPTEPR